MNVFRSKYRVLSGSSYNELERKARKIHNEIAKRTKRSVYVRSAYFNKEKIFIELFWSHLNQKSKRDRGRRLRYYQSAIDLLKNNQFNPETKPNPNGKYEIVHRFMGMTSNDEIYYVQIKEDKRTNRKYFISVFPPK